MPSSNKTLFLSLNKWLGVDKPKKDDFNEDNQKVDAAYSQLSQVVTGHTGNTTVHVTAAERAAWGTAGSFATGTYTGDGNLTKKITLGYQPKFGIVYAKGKGPVEGHLDTFSFFIYSGFLTPQGCSDGIALNTDGFTVSYHVTSRPDGYALRFNDSSITYVYVVWK